MARVLKSFEAQLATKNIFSSFPGDPQPDFHEKGFPEQPAKEIQMIGPCWMDDLAIPLTASTNEELLTNLGIATSTILDLFQSHAMTPNLNKGKTEILYKPRGRGREQFSVSFLDRMLLGSSLQLGNMEPTR